MLENYSMQELKELGGHEVVDANGESIGFVELVFVDDPTGRPEWIGVWSGLPGKGPRSTKIASASARRRSGGVSTGRSRSCGVESTIRPRASRIWAKLSPSSVSGLRPDRARPESACWISAVTSPARERRP